MSSSAAAPGVTSTPAPTAATVDTVIPTGATGPSGPVGASGASGSSGASGPVTVDTSSIVAGLGGFLFLVIFYIVFTLAFMIGAAKMSYDKYHSIGWAILDFFFSSFYYVYYAFFVSKSTTTPGVHPMAGGKWRL